MEKETVNQETNQGDIQTPQTEPTQDTNKVVIDLGKEYARLSEQIDNINKKLAEKEEISHDEIKKDIIL